MQRRDQGYSEFIIFADESGDTEVRNIDPNYPVFLLNFCIFHREEYVNKVEPDLQAFKIEHFGHDQIVLHWNRIRLRLPPFDFGGDSQKQADFELGFNQLLRRLDFTIITTAIDKRHWQSEHTTWPDLYGKALRLCLERTYYFLSDRRQSELLTQVRIESRGKKENRLLQKAFQRICAGENALARPLGCFELTFAPKNRNDSGLQIADRTAHPIGRHIISPDQPNRAWDLLVEPKLCRSPQDDSYGWGLVELPNL